METNQPLYKNRIPVYPEVAIGKFYKFRLIGNLTVFLLFIIGPFIKYNNNQVILLDIENSKFYLFNFIFFPQDFVLIAIIIILIMIALFATTIYAGRVWCGYLCPQTIWIELYNKCARITEGNRNQRKKLEKLNNFNKYKKKLIKHILWLTLAFATAFSFVAYFVPFKVLFSELINFNLNSWYIFWLCFFITTTYYNAGWMCEQFCSLICPYARLQSVMFDENTLIVSYNKSRGEPRSPRKKSDDKNLLNLGDCIDCKMCVNCCPTGIDIRNGLQIECISCAACVDACDSVMEKMNYPKGLISYTKENILLYNKNDISKFKLASYITTFLITFIIFSYCLVNRNLIDFNIVRSQSSVYSITNDNNIENDYLIKITNKTYINNNYEISINNNKLIYVGENKINIASGETVILDIKLILKYKDVDSKFTEVTFKVSCSDHTQVTKKIQFISNL